MDELTKGEKKLMYNKIVKSPVNKTCEKYVFAAAWWIKISIVE